MAKTIDKIKLKKCPFCSGLAWIQLTDYDGIWRAEDYLKNPYRGVKYTLAHIKPYAMEICPIFQMHTKLYNSKEEAARSWNMRGGKYDLLGFPKADDNE